MFHKKDKYFPFATLVLIGILIITTGCRHQTQQLQTVIDGYAQGGTYHIVLVGDSTSNGLKPQIDSILNQIDNSLSLYNPQSLLCRINRGETDTLDHLITSCIRLADSISRESDGRYYHRTFDRSLRFCWRETHPKPQYRLVAGTRWLPKVIHRTGPFEETASRHAH